MPTEPTTRPARVARTAVGLGAALAVAVHLLALYWPVVTVAGPVVWTDKVVHLVLFAVPTYAVGLALRRIGPVALAFAAHAVLSEVIQQTLLPGRSGDVWDAVLDLVGVLVGVLLWWLHDVDRRSWRGRPRS